MQTEDNTQENTPFVDEKTIVLRKPVTLGGVTYATLDLCEPAMDQVQKANRADSPVGVVMDLVSLVAKVPKGVVSQLCLRDFNEAALFLATFNDATPATGATLPPN